MLVGQFKYEKSLRRFFIIAFLMNFMLMGVALFTYQSVTRIQFDITREYMADVVLFGKFELANIEGSAKNRAYFLTGESRLQEEIEENRKQVKQFTIELNENITGAEGRTHLIVIEKATELHQEAVDKIIRLRKSGKAMNTIIKYFEEEVKPKSDALKSALKAASEHESQQFDKAKAETIKKTRWGFILLSVSFLLSTLFGAFLIWTHSKTLKEKLKTDVDLAGAKDAAEAANLAKSSFLANMSHEIRTPLGAVLGFAELITDPKVGPSQAANYIAAIKRNSELLANIINDILDLSKIDANKMKISVHEVGLAEILTDTKTLLDLKAKEQGISLNVTLDDNLPEIIQTDPLRLRQILINIVGNAIKFTSKGSVDVSIHRKTANDGQSLLEFVVKDTGPGIGQDQVEKLFAPFSQVDNTSKRKFGGTGLGLVISKRFANLLGGDVVLTQTSPEKGSVFTITIDPGPILPAQLSKEKKPEITVFLGDRPPLDGIKVLLVEDSPDNQLLISRILKLAGATVDTASDGKEGSEKAKKNYYDVLLMDLQMPVMDGYEATAELREGGYPGKIIALTAHALAEERERCLKSGFDDHLCKPVNRDALIERIEYWARQKKAPLEVEQFR